MITISIVPVSDHFIVRFDRSSVLSDAQKISCGFISLSPDALIELYIGLRGADKAIIDLVDLENVVGDLLVRERPSG